MNNRNWNNKNQNISHKTKPVVHAPYNFVPLSDKVFFVENEDAISHDMPLEDGYCGAIRYEITAESALCVGGERIKANSDEAGEVNMFITPDGEKSYAIPGSSQRGMIRNVLEIATFSKMGFMDDRRFAMRDLSGPVARDYQKHVSNIDRKNGKVIYTPKAKAGWLTIAKDGSGWEILPCDFARVSRSDLGEKFNKQQQVKTTAAKYKWFAKEQHSLNQSFKIGPDQDHQMCKWNWRLNKWEEAPGKFVHFKRAVPDPNANWDGTLVFTGQPSVVKTKEFVFFNPDYSKTYKVPDHVMDSFLKVQKLLESTSPEPETAWQYFMKVLKADSFFKIPVFYLAENVEITTIGLSMMMPIPTTQTPLSLRDNLQDRLHSSTKLDWAEAIFGRVSEKPEQSLKGRVSFSLATLASGQSVQEKPMEAGILGEPKPSYYPAYLKQELMGDMRGKIAQNKNNVRKPKTYMNADAKLAGWKRYPVRGSAAHPQGMPAGLKPKKQLQTKLKAVPAGTRFEGVMRFHNLSKQELGAVLWCLTWGGDEALRHALGTGKPWGLGKVKIAIDQSHWQKDIIPNKIGSRVPSLDTFIQSFEKTMDDCCLDNMDEGDEGDEELWAKTEQIEALKAMADPANAPNGIGLAGQLTYMELGEYTNSKKADNGGPFGLMRYRK